MQKNTRKQIYALLAVIVYLVLVIGVAQVNKQLTPGANETQTLLASWWVFPLAAVAVTVLMSRHFTWAEVGFRKIDWGQMKWMLPGILVLGAGLIALTSQAAGASLASAQWMSLLMVLFVTVCVGYSEELLFRGMVLHSLLEKHGKLIAVLGSGILFGIAHSANALSGVMTVQQALAQAGANILFGLYFALLMLRINCIIPLMIYHCFWDFSLFSATIIPTNNYQAFQVPAGILVEILISVILMVLLIRELRRKTD